MIQQLSKTNLISKFVLDKLHLEQMKSSDQERIRIKDSC